MKMIILVLGLLSLSSLFAASNMGDENYVDRSFHCISTDGVYSIDIFFGELGSLAPNETPSISVSYRISTIVAEQDDTFFVSSIVFLEGGYVELNVGAIPTTLPIWTWTDGQIAILNAKPNDLSRVSISLKKPNLNLLTYFKHCFFTE